jgi:superfamily I DNA and/or RNA helicase
LPPTVKSQESVKLGLDTTILDILTGKTIFSSLLNTQYRMNEVILGFSNQKFYQGLLHSDRSVEKRVLHDDKYPLVFIDTAGCGFEEALHPERLSYSNDGEFFIIREHMLLHYEKWLGAHIGIICPYAEQVKYIRQELAGDTSLSHLYIEVNTIDGFQGQEKEIIYISLVRSNSHGGIGFVEDERRLNVAMTRAQKKLVIVGDSSTLGQYTLYSDLLTYIEEEGHYDSAWNYMSY